MPKKPDRPGSPARRRGARPLADLVQPVLVPVCRQRGFGTADLLTWWPDIVGPAFARVTQPENLLWPRAVADPDAARQPATLVLRVAGAHALLVQQQSAMLLEKLNAFLGYPAIGKLRIVQRPLVPARDRRPPAPPGLGPAAEAELRARIAGVADEGLREALARLGRGVMSSAAAARQPHPLAKS
ncbi:MAG: DciA family protein [Hyphomicrobiales bacterium]